MPSSVFNILDYRLPFQLPARLTEIDSWHTHIPFAFFAVEQLRPNVLVELGTWKGDSYCALAQAVAALGLPTRCFAVDTWAGDAHTGPYNGATLDDLKRHHDPHYGAFSSLLQMTFDDALGRFADGSVDLLHIDGCHHYEAVSHDFNTWLPKLSPRGVVLFHDTAEHTDEFGVWRLWEELSAQYPGFAFRHGHGLGALAVGPEVDKRFVSFLEQASGSPVISELFRNLGERVWLHGCEQRLTADLELSRESLEQERDRSQQELANVQRALAATEEALTDSRRRAALLAPQVSALELRLADVGAELEAAYGSISWRVTRPLRATKRGVSAAVWRLRTIVRLRTRLRELRSHGPSSRSARGTPDPDEKLSLLLLPGEAGIPPATSDEAIVREARRWAQRVGPGRAAARLSCQPLVSVLMPTFETPLDVFHAAVASVAAQTYAEVGARRRRRWLVVTGTARRTRRARADRRALPRDPAGDERRHLRGDQHRARRRHRRLRRDARS